MASSSSTSGGKHYMLLSEPDDSLKCLICLEVAEEPWQHVDCGRLFCKRYLFQYGREKSCPNCRMDQPQYFPDNKSKREIKALPVKCNTSKKNCKWTGTVGTIEKHLTTCNFAFLPCPNKCKDSRSKVKSFMRKNLDKHLTTTCPNRDYKCEYCGEEGTYADITQVHDNICQKKIVPCTNTGCNEAMQRWHIPQHVKSECEHTVVACMHKSIGCETELKRRDLAAHELDDTLHLHMAINTVTQLKENATQSKEAIIQLKDTLITMKEGEPMNIKFIDYELRKTSKKSFTSPSFYTNHGYHMALRVYANGNGDGEGTHVSLYATIVEGKHDSHLYWPFLGSVTVTLLNQLEDKNHHCRSNVLDSGKATVGSARGYRKFIPHSALGHDLIKNTQYLKDDTLYFRVDVKMDDNKPWLQCTASM